MFNYRLPKPGAERHTDEQRTEKISVNFAEASDTLRTVLGLKGSPVAIRFATNMDNIPPGMVELDKTIRHSMMVNLARTEGKIFYATSGKHECNGGAWALGLREMTPVLMTGDTYATMYSPLEKTPFTPHVVMIVTNPRNILKLTQSSLVRLGGRIHAEFSGIQSIRSDAMARTYLSGQPNFSVECDDSRKFSGIPDDEMVMRFPAEMLPEITSALKIVTTAPGSK